MKNLLDDLDLVRGAGELALDDALLARAPREEGVLDNPLRLDHYERVHLQYEAIALACGLLVRDTHRWSERSIEFLPHEKDIV